MAKYDPLCRFLRDSDEQHLDVGMDDIADMVDGGLPPSTYGRARRMWWSNTSDARHVQAATGWLAAAYVVTDVDYAQRRVRFRRGGPRPELHMAQAEVTRRERGRDCYLPGAVNLLLAAPCWFRAAGAAAAPPPAITILL